MATRWISIVDLLSYRESREIVVEEDVESFNKMMHDIGFDMKYGILYQICLHRPMVHKGTDKPPVYTGRFVGEERFDEEWLTSGNASEEQRRNHMWLDDPSFVEELEKLSTYPNFTKMALDRVRENWWFMKDKQEEGKEENEVSNTDIDP